MNLCFLSKPTLTMYDRVTFAALRHIPYLRFRSSLVGHVVSKLDRPLFWFLDKFSFPFKPTNRKQVLPPTPGSVLPAFKTSTK